MEEEERQKCECLLSSLRGKGTEKPNAEGRERMLLSLAPQSTVIFPI
jgi:hypothetical protein